MLGVAVYILKRKSIASGMFYYILTALILTIFAELLFSYQTDFNSIPFTIGHIFKFLSYWMIFQAILQRTLNEPFSIMNMVVNNYDAMPHPLVIINKYGLIIKVKQSEIHRTS